jgi:putative ABC transport system permease protein
MRQSFYLALRYLWFHRIRSVMLIVSVAIVIFLPVGLQRLIEESETRMMARADATPLIVGKKGSSTDLVINTLYFERENIGQVDMALTDSLDETGFGYAIPFLAAYEARGYPIVGTTLDYFRFRNLEIADGRKMIYLGECVIGASVAAELGLNSGDSIISSPENYFDLAGEYPLKMEIAGVLHSTDTPDDRAVFVDLKTTWIIMGLGHGHQDLEKTSDSSVILERDEQNVTANARLYLYNEITGDNAGSFHFHGDMAQYPLSAILFVPDDQKSLTLLRGRFEAGELPHQAVVPSEIVANLLERIFRIKEIFNTVFVLVGIATLLILALIMVLNLRLRKDELYTMFTIGSGRMKVVEILTLELAIILASSLILAVLCYEITGQYVNFFITKYIL